MPNDTSFEDLAAAKAVYTEGYFAGYEDGQLDGIHQGQTSGFMAGDDWGRREMARSSLIVIMLLLLIIGLMSVALGVEFFHR